MIPPIDPSMLAMLMNSGGGAAGGAGAAGGINFGPQGLLGGMLLFRHLLILIVRWGCRANR